MCVFGGRCVGGWGCEAVCLCVGVRVWGVWCVVVCSSCSRTHCPSMRTTSDAA